jgi:hypothetical protein
VIGASIARMCGESQIEAAQAALKARELGLLADCGISLSGQEAYSS